MISNKLVNVLLSPYKTVDCGDVEKNRFYLYLVRLSVCVHSHQRTPCRRWFSSLSLRYQTRATRLLRNLLHSLSHLDGQVAGFGLCF